MTNKFDIYCEDLISSINSYKKAGIADLSLYKPVLEVFDKNEIIDRMKTALFGNSGMTCHLSEQDFLIKASKVLFKYNVKPDVITIVYSQIKEKETPNVDSLITGLEKQGYLKTK